MQKNSTVLLGLLISGVIGLCALVALVVSTVVSVPDFKLLTTKSVRVPIHLANGDKSFKDIGPQAPGWTPIGKIARVAYMAVVRFGGHHFFEHNGVDYHELQEAIKKDLEEKRFARGASTLTEQVVKNAFLGTQKTLWRKFKEFFWAQKIEKVLTKSQILAFYMNMAEWGPGIYGVREAAHHYFKVSPSDLSAKQGAFLAMLLPSPVRYHVYFQRKHLTRWASGQINRILKIMNSMGFIDADTYTAALHESLWGEAVDTSVPADADNLNTEDQAPDAGGSTPLSLRRHRPPAMSSDMSSVPDSAPTSETPPSAETPADPASSPPAEPSPAP